MMRSLILLLLSLSPSFAQSLTPTACPESSLTCFSLEVPLDHAAPEGERLELTFGILPAAGERVGTLVISTGGPGYSGLYVADDYLAPLGEDLLERFDILFFDQRGIGRSGGLRCDNAYSSFIFVEFDTRTPEQRQALLEATQGFVEACVAELERPDLLPYLSTSQAVDDLEHIRMALGLEQFFLYGESYGTQFAQAYAARYPEHLQGLILDGVVDLTLSGEDFYAAQAQAFGDVLTATLEACNALPECALDFGGDALAFYDTLIAELRLTPRPYHFPLPGGEGAEREFTAGMLEYIAADATYGEAGRTDFLRVLAAVARDGNFVPMARLFYMVARLNAATLEPAPDPAFSEAMYYAVDCSDYSFFKGTPEERAAAYFAMGETVEAQVPRLAVAFYNNLPCIFWPVAGAVERPQPLLAEGVPTFILDATLDPATPVSGGISVFGNLADAYRITLEGGRHVIWGYGEDCPDLQIEAFLLRGELPSERETLCPGDTLWGYTPLSPATAEGFSDPLEAIFLLDTELNLLPEYYDWGLEEELTVACDLVGSVTFIPTALGERWQLDDCSFTEGLIVSGVGNLNYNREALRLDLFVSGLSDGSLTYRREGFTPGEGAVSLTGTYAGQDVSFSR